MFSIEPVQKVLPLEREKELLDLFGSNLSSRPIHSLWGSTGHLFVSFNDGQEFKAFDLAPVNQKSGDEKRILRVNQTVSQVVDVCTLKRDATIVYIAHKNGTMKVWSYSQNAGWIHLGNIFLFTSQRTILHSVVLDEGRGRVIWVEGQGHLSDGYQYSVCTRTITFETTNVRQSVGPATTLLKNCPKCALYCLQHAISMWPSHPCPSGLYYTWHSGTYRLKNQLDANVLGRGRCLSEDKANVEFDFKLTAAKLRHVWIQTATIPDFQLVARALHPSTRVLYLVSGTGWIHTLVGAEESLNALRLPDDVSVQQGRDWFAYRFVIGAIFPDHVMRLFSNTTGDLLQTVDMSVVSSTGTDVKLWSAVGSIPRYGVWGSEGMWLLQMTDVETLTSTLTPSEAISTLRTFNEDLLVTRVKVQQACSTSGENLQNVTQLLTKDVGLQNPALAVALLQNTDGECKPKASQMLQSLYEEHGHTNLGTKLNDAMGPQLQQYWQLHKDKLDMWDGPSQTVVKKSLTVENEVVEILAPSPMTSLASRISRMTHLCLGYPRETLRALVQVLDIGSLDDKGLLHIQAFPSSATPPVSSTPPESGVVEVTHTDVSLDVRSVERGLAVTQPDISLAVQDPESGLVVTKPDVSLVEVVPVPGSECPTPDVSLAVQVPESALDGSRPIVSLAVQAPDSESGLPLFEILCRLIFTECPSQLVSFVNLCQKLRDGVEDTMTFSRKTNTVQLYDVAFQCLPGLDHSCDRESSVVAMATLMQLSTMSHGSLNALKLLLKYDLWSEAIHLVQQKSDNSLTHSELFHVLLSNLLQERDLIPEYCERLWACLPRRISSVEFLNLLRTHHQPSNPRIHLCQQVFCRPEDDLDIGMVREQLLTILSRGNLKSC